MEGKLNQTKVMVGLVFLLLFVSPISAWNFKNTDDDFNFIEETPEVTLTDLVKYVEVYGTDVGDIILDQNVYANVTNLTEGYNNGFTVTNGTILALNPGLYHVMSQWSFSGGANTEYHVS